MMACVGLVRFVPIDDFWEPLVFLAAAMAETLTGTLSIGKDIQIGHGKGFIED